MNQSTANKSTSSSSDSKTAPAPKSRFSSFIRSGSTSNLPPPQTHTPAVSTNTVDILNLSAPAGGEAKVEKEDEVHPPIPTFSTFNMKPLSCVSFHHDIITSLHLAAHQTMLFSGDKRGMICVWRAFTESREHNRPPLSSSPIASFSIHTGPIISMHSNTYIGVAVSLAMDMDQQRGSDLCIYSIRAGTCRFVRQQVQHLEYINWKLVAITQQGNIVIYGEQHQQPTLFLYSINGIFICSIPTHEVITCLTTTHHLGKLSATGHEGYIITGGRRGKIVFRNTHTLAEVQTFYTDHLFPQSIPHFISETKEVQTQATTGSVTPSSSPEIQNSAQHADPVIGSHSVDDMSPSVLSHSVWERYMTDSTIPLRCGISCFDIAPSQKHLVVVTYPSLFSTSTH